MEADQDVMSVDLTGVHTNIVMIDTLKPSISAELICRRFEEVSAYSTPPRLGLLFSKAQGCKDFRKLSKACRVGIYWIALTKYSQMSTHVPGFQ